MSKQVAKHGSLLLVDDDRHILESMADWLREQGYELDTASSFEQAIDSIEKRPQDKPYDLVLADIRLADGDGFDILAHCRKNHPAVDRDSADRLWHRRDGYRSDSCRCIRSADQAFDRRRVGNGHRAGPQSAPSAGRKQDAESSARHAIWHGEHRRTRPAHA